MPQSRAYSDLVEAMSDEETETSQVSNPEDDRKWSESTQHFRPIFLVWGADRISHVLELGVESFSQPPSWILPHPQKKPCLCCGDSNWTSIPAQWPVWALASGAHREGPTELFNCSFPNFPALTVFRTSSSSPALTLKLHRSERETF